MTEARVEVGTNGEILLIDPVAISVVRAVGKHNCKNTYDIQEERINYFKQRAQDLGYSPKDIVIVIANVDDINGEILANILMPDYNWQEIRDYGEIPFARGLSRRNGIVEFLNKLEPETIISNPEDNIQVIVVDHGTFEVFYA